MHNNCIFFKDAATTQINTLSLHDALPVKADEACPFFPGAKNRLHWSFEDPAAAEGSEDERIRVFRRVRDEIRERIRRELVRSEEHTSELQSRQYLVCRLLLEKKNFVISPM